MLGLQLGMLLEGSDLKVGSIRRRGLVGERSLGVCLWEEYWDPRSFLSLFTSQLLWGKQVIFTMSPTTGYKHTTDHKLLDRGTIDQTSKLMSQNKDPFSKLFNSCFWISEEIQLPYKVNQNNYLNDAVTLLHWERNIPVSPHLACNSPLGQILKRH